MTLTSIKLSGRSQKQKRTDVPMGLTPSRSRVLGGGRVETARGETKLKVAQHSVVGTVGAHTAEWRILCCVGDISTFKMPLREDAV